MPKPRARHNVKRRPGQVARPKISPFGHGLESVVRHRDGTEFPVVIDLDLIEVGADNFISGAIQRVQHKRGREYLDAFVEASDDAIIGSDIDGTIIKLERAEKIYGYKAEEILGKSISVLIPPSHANEFPEIKAQLRRGEHIVKYETKRITRMAMPSTYRSQFSPVMSSDGMVVGASVVARDITDQKQAEAALPLSEERFRVALKMRAWHYPFPESIVAPTWIRA